MSEFADRMERHYNQLTAEQIEKANEALDLIRMAGCPYWVELLRPVIPLLPESVPPQISRVNELASMTSKSSAYTSTCRAESIRARDAEIIAWCEYKINEHPGPQWRELSELIEQIRKADSA